MLTALDKGVKGGVWFSLIDKVWSERNLLSAFIKVERNGGAAGVDRVTVTQFDEDRYGNVAKLSQELRGSSYRPKAVRRVYIPKPDDSQRPLGIPTVRDRVVQGALRHVLEPIFEKEFHEHSYGFRPGRGCKDALRRVDQLLKDGYRYVVDVDLKSYFDTIPHEPLLARIAERVADGRVLDLIRSFLTTGIMDGLKDWLPTEGAPQGAVISPLLSNVYLNPLDHQVSAAGYEIVRYADDFVILCRSAAEAEAALELVRVWTAEAGLTMHPTKTRIADAATEGFDFLGYRFEGARRTPRAKSLEKLKDTIRAKTRRTDGRSLPAIIVDLNQTLRGWFAYFKHSHATVFEPLDMYVRRRLRCILRKRSKRKGIVRTPDLFRWNNSFFRAHRLFSLKSAHAFACHPLTR